MYKLLINYLLLFYYYDTIKTLHKGISLVKNLTV